MHKLFVGGGDHESVTIPALHKNCQRTLGGVERVLGDLVWSKVRHGGVLVVFNGIILGLFGTVWHRLAWQHLTFLFCI